MKFHLLVYFLLLLLPLKKNLFAQAFPLTTLNSNNVLPIDNIYAAAQDEDGFLWFATDFGLSRFDGYKCTNYNKQNGITGTAVTDIVQATGDSLIFIAYPKSIQTITKKGIIHTLVNDTKQTYHQITPHENAFYFVHRNRPEFAIWENNKFKSYKADSVFAIPELKVNSIFSLGNKGLCYCTNKGLIIQNNKEINIYLKNKDVQIGIKQKNGKILLVVNNQLRYFKENGTVETTAFQLPKKFNPYHIAEQEDGIWIRNIDHGVYRLWQNKWMEMSNTLDLPKTSINEFFTDRDSNFWICTNGKGVLFKKKNFCKNYSTDNGLPNNEVLNLYQQKNRLYIGTANGIGIKTDTVVQPLPLPVAKEGLQYTHQIFKADHDKTGLNIGRTFTFNKKNQSNYTLDYQKEYIAINAMFAWQENDHYLWLFEGPGSSKLVKLENREKESWFDIGGFKIDRIYKMLKWQDEYWVGTNKGYFRINNNTIRFEDSINHESIGPVFDFLIDQKNRLWIATEIGLFYIENEKIKAVPKSNSLAGNYCKSITEDQHGVIWCATWNGIFSYDGIEKQYYYQSTGISSNKNNAILYDNKENALLIGSLNGLDIFPLDENPIDLHNKAVFINATVNDSTNKKLFNGISLAPKQNELNFYLSIPFYNREETITYEYKLDDGVWNTSIYPDINLKNIKSGNHIFYARARIKDQSITNSATSFSFTIKSPFYKTWWFITAMVILGQLLMLWIINHFNRKAKEKKINLLQRDAEFAALKQKAFTALLNPHFIFNALNSIQFYINKNDRQNANKYLSDFASLIRKNFDAAQDSFINLEDELDNLRLYLQLEQMRFSNKFHYSFEINPALATEDWMIPSMVLQPLLENAILHGLMPLEEPGNLFIRISEIGHKLTILIEDDGIGIAKSRAMKVGSKHKSKGMQLIRERLEILSKITKEPLLFTIENASETSENKGTRITLSLPHDLFTEFEKHSEAVKELKD